MNKPRVYLAGPIAGCNKGEANDWRDYVKSKLEPHGIIGVSPLRCEPIVGEKYELQYDDPMFGNARAISSKNELDVSLCTVTLAYLPAEINARRPSYGTISEICWSYKEGKKVVLVSDDDYLHYHPLISYQAGWLLRDLDQGIKVIIDILGIYVD